jgi:hypothetical protein
LNRFCGIDWAEGHHDVAIVDTDGKLMANKRITDDPTGFAELTEMLAEADDSLEDPIPVAIETRAASWSPLYARVGGRYSRSTRWLWFQQAAAEEFRKHPDYAVITSFPGLADLTGARMLAQIGDDRDRHAAALRHLFNKMLGQLYHCLQTRQTFDPIKAFGQPADTPSEQAAA